MWEAFNAREQEMVISKNQRIFASLRVMQIIIFVSSLDSQNIYVGYQFETPRVKCVNEFGKLHIGRKVSLVWL